MTKSNCCQFCGDKPITHKRYKPSENYPLAYDLCDDCTKAHKKAWDDLHPTPPNEGKEIEGEIENLVYEIMFSGGCNDYGNFETHDGKIQEFITALTALCTKYGKEREEKIIKYIDGLFKDNGDLIDVTQWNIVKQTLLATAQAEREGEV